MEIQCTNCNLIIDLTKNSIRRNKRKNNGKFICHQCKISDTNYKSKISKILIDRNASKEHKEHTSKKLKEHWEGEYGNNRRCQMQSSEYKEQMSKSIKQAWKDSEYRAIKSKQSSKLWEDEEFRNLVSQKCAEKWKDDDYRKKVINNIDRDKISENSKEMWADPEFREKMIKIINNRWSDDRFREKMIEIIQSDEYRKKAALARQNQATSMTKPHQIICEILNDLDVAYRIEEAFGPYNVDIFLPTYDTIIEVQGDYWHSLAKTITKDRQKNTYLTRYFPHVKIEYIWEHQLMSREFATTTIKQWLGLSNIKSVEFDFNDITISEISNKDAHMFLSKYHYWLSVGKKATVYGAFFNDDLIAVCCFSPLTRKESAMRLGYTTKEMAELSRFCIHPKYQKKNFASWFMSRCIRLIKKKNNDLRCLLTFADTTFEHDGTIYKATNWKFDGVVRPSYWYVDKDGHTMHKKTLWDHAKSLRMTEKEFAKKKGYRRINGNKKLRFIYPL